MAHRTLWGIVGLVLVIAVGAGGFFLGVRYESAQAAAAAAERAQFLQQRLGAQGQGGGFFGGAAGGNFGGGAGGGNFGGARGTIESVNGDTVVVNGPQGPVTIHLSAEARIFKSVEGSKDDLKAGENVTITGQRNPDGSINATAVILQPSLER